jgi:hypothetical protein
MYVSLQEESSTYVLFGVDFVPMRHDSDDWSRELAAVELGQAILFLFIVVCSIHLVRQTGETTKGDKSSYRSQCKCRNHKNSPCQVGGHPCEPLPAAEVLQQDLTLQRKARQSPRGILLQSFSNVVPSSSN